MNMSVGAEIDCIGDVSVGQITITFCQRHMLWSDRQCYRSQRNPIWRLGLYLKTRRQLYCCQPALNRGESAADNVGFANEISKQTDWPDDRKSDVGYQPEEPYHRA